MRFSVFDGTAFCRELQDISLKRRYPNWRMTQPPGNAFGRSDRNTNDR
jgi:hypothetical protein